MTILYTVIGLYLFLLIGWILYVAIMALKDRRDRLHPFAKFNAYLALALFGYPWDLVMNLLVCVAFVRIPRDWLLTGTLKRALSVETGWREATASWICTNLLNQFDPSGKHC